VAGGQGDAEAAPVQQQPLAVTVTVTVTQSWEVDHMVLGLAWVDGPVLATFLEMGPRLLIFLYNQQGQCFQLSVVFACHTCSPPVPCETETGIALSTRLPKRQVWGLPYSERKSLGGHPATHVRVPSPSDYKPYSQPML
jgi:hypothetical protein